MTDVPPITAEQQEKFVFPAALAAHSRQGEHVRTLLDSLTSLTGLAVQASLAINGGAAVATLALLSSLAARDPFPVLDYGPVIAALSWFGCGVVTAAVSAAFAYAAQYNFFLSAKNIGLAWSPATFTYETSWSKLYDGRASKLRIAAALAILCSYSVFALGALAMRDFAIVSFAVLKERAVHSAATDPSVPPTPPRTSAKPPSP